MNKVINKIMPGLLAASIFFVAFGCKTGGVANQTRTKANKYTVEDLDFKYLSSKARLQYTEDNQIVKANAEIRMVKDSVIWISVRSSTGIEGARLLITQDSAYLVNRLKKEFYALDYNMIYEKAGFDINFDLVQSIITGDVPDIFDTEVTKPLRTDDFFAVKETKGDYEIESQVSRLYRRLKEIKATDIKTKNVLVIEYDLFQDIEDQVFPHYCKSLLTYSDTANNTFYTDFEITHINVELPKKEIKFSFKIPEKYVDVTKGYDN